MYLVQKPDYYFGVEIEASFTQTTNGLDAWGHDIIYEFTGDDDFWLYVDGELIIDLGGIHSALPGSVNYSTGDVYVNGTHHTLRELFESNYRGRNPGAREEDVTAYLDQYFDAGSTVFKDYSTHTMRIFYMERGAGASNLHMRFNLASVKEGTVLLSKALDGVDTTESVFAEFPYQIWYRTASGEEKLLEQGDLLNTTVFYKDTITPVTYYPTLTIDGVQYEKVFMLKPGEIAEINLPEDADTYRIVECGVNTAVYSSVTANGSSLEGEAVPGHDGRMDYGISEASAKDRARVDYVNTVNPDALRNLTITKRLYREDGETALSDTDDLSTFDFRLYLGTEYADAPGAANIYTYHVKDAQGNYCTWNEARQRLISMEKSNYDELTDAEKAAASFSTSMNGSITQIPVGYTVEVRGLLAGTQFQVVERPWEIPDGYSFQKYVYKGEPLNDAAEGVRDTVAVSQDPHVDVCNLRGWGLRVYKNWSDTDYMSEREDTYFAVYTDNGSGNLTLVEGTVRRLKQKETTLYWYFLPLPHPEIPFNNYLIREVTVTNPTVNEEGEVTAYDDSVVPIDHNGEVRLSSKQKGETASSEFTYTVLYDKGEVATDSNVRVDTVTNNRPGIVLKKQDWNGNALAGAAFTLTDSDGNAIGSFVSDADGQITVAFLRDNVDYTLTETRTPQGYHGLEAPMIIPPEQWHCGRQRRG